MLVDLKPAKPLEGFKATLFLEKLRDTSGSAFKMKAVPHGFSSFHLRAPKKLPRAFWVGGLALRVISILKL